MSKVRNPLKQQFFNYLTRKCSLADTTASMYISCLNRADKYMQTAGIINDSLYDIRKLRTLELAKDEALVTDEFNLLDEMSHFCMGISLRHYYNFAAAHYNFNHSWEW